MRDSSSGPLYASHVKRSLFGSPLFTYNRVLGYPILQLWLSITSRDQHIMWAFTCPICSVLRFLLNLSHSPSFLFLLVLSPLVYPPPYVHYCFHLPLYILNSVSLLTVHSVSTPPSLTPNPSIPLLLSAPPPLHTLLFFLFSPIIHSLFLPFVSISFPLLSLPFLCLPLSLSCLTFPYLIFMLYTLVFMWSSWELALYLM